MVPRPNLIERELSRLRQDPVSVRTAARVIVITTLAIVVVGGVAMTLLDRDEYSNVWEGMWWAIQTVTTVGYGDVTPKSAAGRLVAAALMLEGVAFVAIVTAAITSTFVERAREARGVDDATARTSPNSVSTPSSRTSASAWPGSSRCSANNRPVPAAAEARRASSGP